MPTLIDKDPDTADLDYFFTYFKDSFGLAFFEDEKDNNIKPIPPKQAPTTCFIKSTRSNKATHFFCAPSSTALVTCLCGKYHTQFISQTKTTYQHATNFTSIAMGKKQSQKSVELINTISESNDNIPPSPTPKTCQHTCPKCSKVITCKIINGNHYPNTVYTVINKKVYHSSCIAESSTSTTSTSATPTTPSLEQARKDLTPIFQATLPPKPTTTTTTQPSTPINIKKTNTSNNQASQQHIISQTNKNTTQPQSTFTSNSPLPKYTYSKTQSNPQPQQNPLSQTIQPLTSLPQSQVSSSMEIDTNEFDISLPEDNSTANQPTQVTASSSNQNTTISNPLKLKQPQIAVSTQPQAQTLTPSKPTSDKTPTHKPIKISTTSHPTTSATNKNISALPSHQTTLSTNNTNNNTNNNNSQNSSNDSNITNNNNNNNNDSNQTTATSPNQPKVKANPSFDWLFHFPITDEMKDKTKLETPMALQLFDFLKLHLYNFYPGKILKEANDKNLYPLRANFQYLIRTMAASQPKFLLDFIYSKNPDTNPKASINFTILETTLKNLIHKFTSILFTQFNYHEIFASALTVPPYKPENRIQFCLNLARIHLYLSENYQCINYTKFAEDFNLRPKTFKLISHIISTDQDKEYLTIKSDDKFNINLLFNLPQSLFLHKFSIPPLKNSEKNFDEWFKNFFPIYKRQFTSIDKQETYDKLRYLIKKAFTFQLKQLLPSEYIPNKPSNSFERQLEYTRFLNYHMLTCTHKDCSYVQNGKHNIPDLRQAIKQEFDKHFPIQENENLPIISIDSSIFHTDNKYPATFLKPIPTKTLDKLADEAEQQICKKYSTTFSKSRRNFYFYQYLQIYQDIAAENHNISDLSKKQAIDLIAKDIVPTDYLARVITYFDLFYIQDDNTKYTFSQISKHYLTSAFPEAEKILSLKFKIKFEVPEIDDSLFIKEDSFFL